MPDMSSFDEQMPGIGFFLYDPQEHREMLDQVLTIFDVKPGYDLNIMKLGQDLGHGWSGDMPGTR